MRDIRLMVEYLLFSLLLGFLCIGCSSDKRKGLTESNVEGISKGINNLNSYNYKYYEKEKSHKKGDYKKNYNNKNGYGNSDVDSAKKKENISEVSKKDYECMYIKGEGVRFRTAPSLKSYVKMMLNDKERVYVIKKSDRKERIGNYEDYWYKVKRENLDVGWVYGAFLKPCEEGMQSSPFVGEYRLKANLRYATGWNGGFLILKSDGTYIFAPPDSSYIIHKYVGAYKISDGKLILKKPIKYTRTNPISEVKGGTKEIEMDISKANINFPVVLFIKFDQKTGKPFFLINEDDLEIVNSPSHLPIDTSCYEKVK